MRSRRVVFDGVVDSELGYHESRRCSRDTYPESYRTPSILIYEEKNRDETLISVGRDPCTALRQVLRPLTLSLSLSLVLSRSLSLALASSLRVWCGSRRHRRLTHTHARTHSLSLTHTCTHTHSLSLSRARPKPQTHTTGTLALLSDDLQVKFFDHWSKTTRRNKITMARSHARELIVLFIETKF